MRVGHLREGDPQAVVDSNFNVYGTKGLRIVDASVFPYITNGNIKSVKWKLRSKVGDRVQWYELPEEEGH